MKNKTKANLSIIFGIIGILILPIVFGPLAIYFGYIANKTNSKRRALIGISLGVLSLILMFFSSFIIKSIIYPNLRSILDTSDPLAIINSESMEHNMDFDEWWEKANKWYIENDIDKNKFKIFPFKNGFNKGDILIVKGIPPDEIQIGDVIIFWYGNSDRVAHRVVKISKKNEEYLFITKGDNYKTNAIPIKNQDFDETIINKEKIIGKSIIRIPYLGWIKLWYINMTS